MQRARSHARLHLIDDGTVEESAVADGGGNPDALHRRATDGSDSRSSRLHAVSSSTGLARGGGVAPPPPGGLLSPDSLTPDGIVLRGVNGSGVATGGSDGDDGDGGGWDAVPDVVTPPPLSRSWVDTQAGEEAERANLLRLRRAQRKQQSLDRLVAA